jgi:hypothetical protein
MNPIIKQLADQADMTDDKYGMYFAKDFDSHCADGVDLEKFAELIIQECCSKLVEIGESWHEFANNPPQGQAHNASGALFAAYRLKEDAVDEIKEHFGVKE